MRRIQAFSAVLLLAVVSRPALADVCFPTPVTLPGLSGVPIWQGGGVLRSELNEPRWAAAPQTAFDSDITGNEGLYRILVDPSYSELSVSFQAPTDPSVPSNADVIYFAFSTDGTAGTLAKGVAIQVNGTGATDPTAAAIIQQENYDATVGWSALSGAPTWLKDPAVWRNNVAGDAAWGINFKVNLAAAGLSASAPFKIQLALHKQDEATPSNSVNMSTPAPATNPLLSGTLLISDPTHWANAVAINSGCAAGITLSGNQIGTTNLDAGNPAPNEVNTTLGAVNQFYAKPTIPGSVALFSGLFQGKFHVANWGSIAASNAPWTPIPSGLAVLNGASPAPDDATIEFNCPANGATTTCGLPTPAEKHQCVYVELKAAPGQTVPFTRAAAYTNMQFQPLSNFSAPAEISVKGLKQVFGNDLPRDVYVYLYPKNMPAQGNKPIYLPTDKMAATRRFFETPPASVRHAPGVPVGVVDQNKQKLAAAKATLPARPSVAGAAATAAGALAPAKVAAVVAPPKAGSGGPSQALRELPLPNTGIGDLDLSPRQALSAIWPSYDVHVYYDSGKAITIGGITSKQLVPMFPFTYFHSHEGPLFGFSHGFQLTSGAELKELRADVYWLKIPSEGVAHVITSVAAHETPKDPGNPPPGCPECPPPVEKNGHCGCRIPGQSSAGGAPWGLFAAGVLGIALARRRRARRAPSQK
jgi:MYXO-CTERM domain-containing protein